MRFALIPVTFVAIMAYSVISQAGDTLLQAFDLRSCRSLIFSEHDELSPSLAYMSNPLIARVQAEVSTKAELLLIGYVDEPGDIRKENEFSLVCAAQPPQQATDASQSRQITCYAQQRGSLRRAIYRPVKEGGDLKVFRCTHNCALFPFARIYQVATDEGLDYGPRFLKESRQYRRCRDRRDLTLGAADTDRRR